MNKKIPTQLGPYIIDTSSLINLRNYYPHDMFAPVWLNLEKLIQAGAVFLCTEIIDEIRDDDLIEWIKPHKQLVLKPDRSVQKQVGLILNKFGGLVDIKKTGSGDPFIIAHALLNGWTVVTDEKNTESPKKIPHVCKYYGVPYVNLIGLLRQTGFKWSHK